MRTLILACLCALSADAQSINTIAGSGIAGYSGDGAAAISAMLDHPFGVATGTAGELYIADRANNRIRKITTSGDIVTIAGNGTVIYNGDNLPATAAAVNDPTGVATDAAGYIYIADRGNNRVRKVDPAGIITTIAGSATAGWSGDNGPAAAALLSDPRCVATDAAGNVYIADRNNQRIRKIDAAGIITTIAGNGSMGYSGDGGPAIAAGLNNPYSIATDNSGNIYIADVDNERIRKVDVAGIISTIAGNGSAGYSGDGAPATAAQLHEPIGIAADAAGNLYIADGWNNCIRMVSAAGMITTIAGTGIQGYSGDGGPATAARLHYPYGIAVTSVGNIYIADNGNNRIRYIARATAVNNVNAYKIAVVYPSPAMDVIYISSPCKSDYITITDLSGHLVFRCLCNGKDTMVNVSAYPPGIYYARVNNEVIPFIKK